MYKYLLLFPFLIFTSCFQNNSETKDPPKKADPKPTKSDGRFLQFIENEVVTTESEKKYISNISKHQKVKLVSCDATAIHYKDEIEGTAVELKISIKPFDKTKHKLQYKVFNGKQSKDCELVDGVRPRGGFYGCPTTEFDVIEFSINGHPLDLGKHFDHYYNLKMCENYLENFSPSPMLTYSGDGLFNLYLIGGKGIDKFFTKVIIDGSRIVKSYYLDYNQLRDNGGFDKDFSGF